MPAVARGRPRAAGRWRRPGDPAIGDEAALAAGGEPGRGRTSTALGGGPGAPGVGSAARLRRRLVPPQFVPLDLDLVVDAARWGLGRRQCAWRPRRWRRRRPARPGQHRARRRRAVDAVHRRVLGVPGVRRGPGAPAAPAGAARGRRRGPRRGGVLVVGADEVACCAPVRAGPTRRAAHRRGLRGPAVTGPQPPAAARAPVPVAGGAARRDGRTAGAAPAACRGRGIRCSRADRLADHGRGLLDALAMGLHVLWTYQQAWADEGFLATARLPASVRRLLASSATLGDPGFAASGLQHFRCREGTGRRCRRGSGCSATPPATCPRQCTRPPAPCRSPRCSTSSGRSCRPPGGARRPPAPSQTRWRCSSRRWSCRRGGGRRGGVQRHAR